ncbi:hypothetical protein EON65_19255 [archaeon]|nr:MAG: hypothetical protein EON65_19255 [archaeon]
MLFVGRKRSRLKLPPWPSLPPLPSLPSLPSMPTLSSLSNLVYTGACHGCTQNISMVNTLTRVTKCRICAQCFCSSCIKKSACPVPFELVHDAFKPKGQTAPTLVQPQPVCSPCMPLVIDNIMEQFRRDMDVKYCRNIAAYLQNPRKTHDFFPLPTQTPEDTRYRQLLRFVLVAEVVASFTKASMAFKAVKFAYQGNVLINILVQNDILFVLQPVMEALHKHGIVTSPSALLRLYYLGCKHTLLSKIDTSLRSSRYTPMQRGVLASACPVSVLDYVNTYVSAAQFLYIAKLPPPHSGKWMFFLNFA